MTNKTTYTTDEIIYFNSHGACRNLFYQQLVAIVYDEVIMSVIYIYL